MIRIIRGVYGFIDQDGVVRPKTSKDGPFKTDDDKEARLVKQGVAEYVSDEPEEADEEPEAEPLPVELEAEPLPVELEEADEELEKKPAPKKPTKKASKKSEDAEEEPPVISAADPE